MSSQPLIVNKEEFLREVVAFFKTIREPAPNSGHGEIEIRVFPRDRGASPLLIAPKRGRGGSRSPLQPRN